MRHLPSLRWLIELPRAFDDALAWDHDMLLDLDDDPGEPDWTTHRRPAAAGGTHHDAA